MTNTSSPAIQEIVRPAQTVSEALLSKRKSYQRTGAALLCTAAAAFAAKVFLSSPAMSDTAFLLPAIRNASLLLVMACSLILSIISRKADPPIVHAIAMICSLSAGILFGVLRQNTPITRFSLYIGFPVVITGCMLYLVYHARYVLRDPHSLMLTGDVPSFCMKAKGAEAGK